MDVLLVDDDETEHLLMARYLGKPLDANLHGARTIAEAEEILKKTPVDLILLDLFIPGPGKDGFTFLMKLKVNKKFKKIPVVLISNSVSERDREIALKLGASSFLVKMNFSLAKREEFLKKITAALEGHKDKI